MNINKIITWYCIASIVMICSRATAQNVGIGISTPLDKLHVFDGNATLENNLTNYPWLSFRNNNVIKGYIGVNHNDLRIGTSPGNSTGFMAFFTGSSERMRIASDGEVGIGIISPLSKLHIANTSGPTQFTIGANYTSGGYTALYMGTSALSNGYSYIQGVRFAGGSFGDIMLNPSGGNIGILTTSTRGIFDIGGTNESVYIASNTTTGNQRTIYMPGNIIVSPWNVSDIAYIDARRTGSSTAPLSLQIRTTQSNGTLTNSLFLKGKNIAVAHSDPRKELDVDGDLLLRNSERNEGFTINSASGELDGVPMTILRFDRTFLPNANAEITSLISWNGTYYSLSDGKFKKNIRQQVSSLKNIMKLNPVQYQYKFDSDNMPFQSGFIAQEVEVVYPELVVSVKDKKGTPTKLLNYDGFAVLAIKAIQEQQILIEKLQHQINELKAIVKPGSSN